MQVMSLVECTTVGSGVRVEVDLCTEILLRGRFEFNGGAGMEISAAIALRLTGSLG